jgi:hypothetical protein
MQMLKRRGMIEKVEKNNSQPSNNNIKIKTPSEPGFRPRYKILSNHRPETSNLKGREENS